MGARGAQRHGDPRVLVEPPPAGKCEPSPGPERTPDVGEAFGRLGKEHDAHPRHRGIELGFGKRIDSGVGLDERHVPGAGEPRLRALKHRLRYVDAENPSLGRNKADRFDCDIAGAAADVDDALARTQLGVCEQLARDERDVSVLRFLPRNPGGAAGAVPIIDHVRVGGIRCNEGHAQRLALLPAPPPSCRRSGWRIHVHFDTRQCPTFSEPEPEDRRTKMINPNQ